MILSSVCSALTGYIVALIIDRFYLINQVAHLGWAILLPLIAVCLNSYYAGLVGGFKYFRIGVFSAFTMSFATTFVGVSIVAIATGIATGVNIAVAVAGSFIFAIAVAGVYALAVAVAVAVTLTLFASYFGYRAIKGDARDAWIRNIAVAFAATGGTSFYNATLTDADLRGATLKNTNLRTKFLTRTLLPDSYTDAMR